MEEQYTLVTETGINGIRLDKYLSDRLPDAITRSFLQKLIKEEQVTVDGKLQKANYKLKPEQTIQITIPPAEETAILPEDIPLDILYEDNDLLIVNKPKDMVVHPSAGHYTGTLVNAIMFHCKESLSGINGEIRPGIVHRIDKDTTGSLIICKNDESHLKIAEQIKEHSVKRIYRGIVSGTLKESEGTVEGNIGRHPIDRKKMALVTKGGKPAITHYRVLEQFKNAAYMEFRLETGRTHQIRVHMASIGHPLLGDTVYGNAKNPYKLNGQTLHAMTIGFIHPTTGEYLEVSAPIPEYFNALIKKLR
ncbi:RluA family pseudouridine synthase [Roseburia sp. BX1005]|uniref:Pseudouridine synthase n=1 Tax=Roseburia zhanii TaxID=2763064 RepID=A0A923LNU6_9FIRM|nr:RluA family pseudouridine synthase [Roseburia zhanii]MBC5713236.1 RluA family pseudouridine synthase [Roseburia zhanii]